MLVQPVHGIGRHEWPAAQFRRDVANIEQRLQHPKTLDIDGDICACALIHRYFRISLLSAIARRGSTPESVCCRIVW
jgi:hypothetical protein